MTPLAETWTTVLVGAWNVRLFMPDWVSKKLFDGKEITLEIPFPTPSGLLKVTADGISIIVNEERLIVSPEEQTGQAMARAEAVTRRILRVLEHTPVRGVGINFGFEEAAPSDHLTRLFEVADHNDLSDLGCVMSQTTVVRRLTFEGTRINLTHSLLEDGKVQVHFNFHDDAKEASAVAAKLEGWSGKCLEIARKFLADVYRSNIVGAA